MIEAKICNCNNIASATIRLKKNYLNIYYAMNGIGKSTIALAIKGCSEHNDLDFLHPFGSKIDPTCELSEEGLSVLLFNEDYVDQFVFQQSEVIQNSFDVFIKTPEYLAKQASIKEKLERMHVNVSQNEDLQRIVSVGKLIKTKLPVTSTGGFRQSGTFKSLMSSASPYKLPEELSKFQPLMERDYTVEWVAWKHDGTKYDSADICPFCSLDLGKEYESQKRKFTDSYAKSDVKNRIEMLGYFHSVEEFMDTSSKDKLHRCIQGLETDEVTKLWITMFHHELDVLVGCITKIDNFNSHQVRIDDISKLDEQLVGLVIDKSNLRIFKSKRLEESIDSVNQIIEELRKETESLKQEIGELTSYIVSRSRDAIEDINDFLFTAGINYSFEIHPDAEDTSSTILKYKAIEPVEVEDIKLHLSWGERNAFALVLFMHDALSKQPDVIILDDPISSFDRNKKYAIINRLFSSRRDSFFRKTVLMLTHDLQPIIDCLVNNKPRREFVSACFLQNKEGVISEQEITPDDVKSITLLLSEHAKNEEYNKVHRVISLRKLLEYDPANDPAPTLSYDLLSSLLHGRANPTHKDGNVETELTPEQISTGEDFIERYIPEFKYADYAGTVFSRESLMRSFKEETNLYSRLQIFRVLIDIFELRLKIDDPILKYIDEQLHVENDYMFELDFMKYDIVPDFVIPLCVKFLDENIKV